MTAAAAVQFNPYDPAFQDDPYTVFERLRAAGPLHYDPESDTWYVHRYDDCVTVLRDADTYSSVTKLTTELLPMLASMDPPRHDELRNILAADFTPARLAHIASLIRSISEELLSGIADRGTCEFISEFAVEIPTRVASTLIGVPDSERGRFRELTDLLFPTFDPESGFQSNVAGDFYTLASDIITLRRNGPGNDLLSRLLEAKVRGEPLTQEELLAYALQLVGAGFETTRSLIGNTAWLLAQHPEQRRTLRQSPQLVRNAIEESLRFESPSPAIFRAARRDTSLQGQTIRAGATVWTLLGAANRDPDAFERPDVFDIQRKFKRPHLAFAYGIHFCLGNHLARLEGTICLEEMLRILPDWYLTDPNPRRHRVPIARGFLSLPLGFTPH